MSTPISVIHIISGVPLNNSYEHTLYFPNEIKQREYFDRFNIKTFERFTYLRPAQKIKVAGYIDNAHSWNYLMFKNGSKWFYHFINKVEYVSDNCVELHIELDVIQTYMFDWDLHKCFIERQHTISDDFGEHTIPEGLDTGPLVQRASNEINLEDNVIMVAMSTNCVGENNTQPAMYGGVFSGLDFYAWYPEDVSKVGAWLNGLNNDGQIDSIVAMWMYPKQLATIADYGQGNNYPYRVSNVGRMDTFTFDDALANGYIGSHKVVNKKLLCYPYTMLYVSNNMGNAATFHRELFTTYDGSTKCYKFDVIGALSPDAGVQLVPYGYKTTGAQKNFEDSLTMPPFPMCAWVSDTYKVWLAQNQNTLDHSIEQAKIKGVSAGVSGIAGVLASALNGNVLGIGGSAIGGINGMISAQGQIDGIMASKSDMAVQPDQARGRHSGSINLTHGRMGFSIYTLSITDEYAERLDDYFTRYGYRVNKMGTPNTKARSRFTYIKTVGCFVSGELGTEAQLKIQAIFDKGITFWADVDNIGNYDLANTC